MKKTAIEELKNELVKLVQTYGGKAFQEALRNCYSVDLTGDLTEAQFMLPTNNARTIELPDDVFEALYCRIVKADQDVSHLTAMVISKNACSIEIGSTTFTRAKKEDNE